jgi:rubredoxin-NAD+ reductase
MTAPLIIIGTGLAGYNLAREYRKLSPDAPLQLISADGGDFYSKPMLSTALASQKSAAQLVMKPVEKMAEELRAEIWTETPVLRLDPALRRVHTARGELAYSQLVLALGADAFAPPLAGDAAGQVLQVNDLDDYARFRAALAGRERVLLLGAGLIGCEFAQDLASSGIQVTVVDPAGWPLSRLLPEAAGRYLQARLEALGVRFCFGQSAQAVERAAGCYAVQLADGSTLQADLVLSAIGLRPRTQLATEVGLAVARGIVVDRQLRSSDAQIYALGDCAEVAGLVLPYVQPIMQSARVLAANLAGQAQLLSYPAMPVLVKTPACPTIVCPPLTADGEWECQALEGGLRALYRDGTGRLLGFALLGSATTERGALSAQLPAWLG